MVVRFRQCVQSISKLSFFGNNHNYQENKSCFKTKENPCKMTFFVQLGVLFKAEQVRLMFKNKCEAFPRSVSQEYSLKRG